MCPVQSVTYVTGSDQIPAQGTALGMRPGATVKP